MKEFEINVVVTNEQDKFNENELAELFIDWLETNELKAGGSIKELKEED